MSHAAEGTLHAYLDVLERGPESGALDAAGQAELERHVAQCEVCAAALAEARSLRTRAGAVLDGAAPVFEVPPFESMTARRAPARPVRRWVPLAWAASLMMAVGAGWIASGLWREGSIDAPFGQVQETASEAGSAETAAQDGAAGDVATDAQGAPEASLQADASGERQVAAPPPTVSVESLAAPEQRVAIPERRFEAELPPAPAATGGERNLAAKARATEAAAGAAAPAAPPPPGAAQDAANRDEEEAAFPGDADVAWKPVTMTAAVELLGGAPLDLIAGARVLSIQAADSARVRVVQVLAGGAQVELVQRPGGASAALAQAERADALRVVREGRSADGRAWVVVAREGRELALRAPAGMVPLALVAQLERR